LKNKTGNISETASKHCPNQKPADTPGTKPQEKNKISPVGNDCSPHWAARIKHWRVKGYCSNPHLWLQNLKKSHKAKHNINPTRATGILYLQQ